MAAVTSNINQARAMRVAVRRIEGFAKQFGEAHQNLARHAAFPLVLTPDLLYQIWANFVPEAPWTAVAHVLLSRLCRQVGYEMYEMDIADRNLLLRELKEQFGQKRLDELGEFLLDYVAHRLTDDDPDTQDLAQAQEWTALVYIKPHEVARELAQAVSARLQHDDMTELFRLASLVETLAEPLVEFGFEPLLVYSRAMESFVRGDRKDAAEQFINLPIGGHRLVVAGVTMEIPPELLPQISVAWFNRGNQQLLAGDFVAAIASFDRACEIQPDNYSAWIYRGNALINLGRYEEAIASFDFALNIKPDLYEAWHYRGNALAEGGQYEEAISSWDRALVIQPDFLESWIGRGVGLANLGRHEEAIASYDRAIQLKSDLPLAWYNRGNAFRGLQRYEEAIASYDRALALKDDYYQAWLDRGIAATRSTRAEPVFASFSPLAMRNPALNQRGFEGALISYQEGLKYVQPDTHPEGWGQLHRAIGNAHYERGRQDPRPHSSWRKAVTEYQQALRTITPNAFPQLHLEVLQDLIKALLNLGQTAEAAELQRQGRDLLQRLLNEPQHNTQNKKQLALKFTRFNQLSVDQLIQEGHLVQALELAEVSKNASLDWLLNTWNSEIASPSWLEIQQLLSPTTTIIYWYISPASLTTFILKHNTTAPVIITLPNNYQRLQQLEDLVKNWNQQYTIYRQHNEQQEVQLNWRDNLPKMLERLTSILDIPSILSHLIGIKQLILIPHRDLHCFPLHALFPDDFIITYLPSLKTGLNLRALSRNATYELLSVEHPNSAGLPSLPFAEIEAALISQMFPKATHICGNQATQEQVITALQQPHRIFHFTGQSAYNFSNPQQSALFLSGTDRLTVKDLYAIDLRSYQLVCLNACETAITGKQTITTEYIGLASAFIGRGVAYVVSPLWTVEPAYSTLLMIYFYQQLKVGKAEAAALAAAQRWIRNVTFGELAEWYREKIAELPVDEVSVRSFLITELRAITREKPTHQPYAHPCYWAAFTITGTV